MKLKELEPQLLILSDEEKAQVIQLLTQVASYPKGDLKEIRVAVRYQENRNGR